MFVIEVLIGLSALIISIYYYLTWTFDFWNKRGVPGPKPSALFGTLKNVFLGKIFIGEYVFKEYQNYKNEPMFGIFAGREPVLVLKDAEAIKNVLIKDFSSFTDRGFGVVRKSEPLNDNLFFLEPERWRPVRTTLSPVFTSGKLKQMFYLLLECADHFGQYFGTLIENNPIIECREIMARLNTDIIGVCAFGLQMNALDEYSLFRKYGRKCFDTTVWDTIKVIIRYETPWLYDLLWPIMVDNEKNDFFINIMRKTMEYRKNHNVKKHDLVDLLMEIRDNPHKEVNIETTHSFLTAQANAFFIAGFETSSSVTSCALYELAFNQSIQNKLREEINLTYVNNDGILTFDSIKNMEYLQKVYNETLRKHSPLAMLYRRSVKDYTIPGTKVTIPNGTSVWIPIFAIHRDPNNYPNPDIFDPERFNEENVKKRHSSHFLPFGDGPKYCIGSRFANYQVKIGLISILKNYKVEVCDKTSSPLEYNPRSPLVFQPKDGIFLRFTKLS